MVTSNQTWIAVFTGRELHRFADFDRVTCAGGQRTVHVSVTARCAYTRTVCRADNRFAGARLVGRHKSTACPHIHHQRIQPFRQFSPGMEPVIQRDGIHRRGNRRVA